MKSTLIVALLVCLGISPALAAERSGSGAAGPADSIGQERGQTVEQKKAEIIKHVQDRIASSQSEITCLQAATTHDALRACREKYRPPRPHDDRRNNAAGDGTKL